MIELDLHDIEDIRIYVDWKEMKVTESNAHKVLYDVVERMIQNVLMDENPEYVIAQINDKMDTSLVLEDFKVI